MTCKSGSFAFVGDKSMCSLEYEDRRAVNEKAGIFDEDYQTPFADLQDCDPEPKPDDNSFDM